MCNNFEYFRKNEKVGTKMDVNFYYKKDLLDTMLTLIKMTLLRVITPMNYIRIFPQNHGHICPWPLVFG